MDRHSLSVKILIIALPILALGMLGVVFLLDWSNSGEVTEQFSESDDDFSSDVQAQIDAPSLSAISENGDEITLNAKSLQRESDETDSFVATDIEGDILVGGSEWEIESTEGETDSQGRMAEFRGRVLALIDQQYNLLGSQVIADVNERSFTSQFPIEVKSDRFDISADSGSMNGVRGERVIVLDGRVKGVIRLGEADG